MKVQRKIVNIGQVRCVWAIGISMVYFYIARIVNFESGEEGLSGSMGYPRCVWTDGTEEDSQYGSSTMCMGNGEKCGNSN